MAGSREWVDKRTKKKGGSKEKTRKWEWERESQNGRMVYMDVERVTGKQKKAFENI